ncbi:hypothetical protein CRI94_00325 [Longibacter salinarum]|uniref:Kinase n=1 Tax=Longibacter salinarum TaxID=1850348 RepID=A0A2A8D352_9BACT|nr:hypothetical protein CRI94_00325 [Longibacter salinarum]
MLKDPSIYPHEPDSIELKQTHISIIALAPPFVYKVKKPVDFGFLDFTTLQKREAACQSEVKLNRRLCADTYLGVVHLAKMGDGYRFESDEGTTVEVAVKMRYLPPDGFLHTYAEEGTLTKEEIDRVVSTLSDFYDGLETAPEIAERGWVDHLRVNTDENFDQTRDHAGWLLPKAAYRVLQDYTDRFYDAHAALLNRRRTGGYFINGHGDLRLEHVHLSDKGVCIYDCIEFNDRFRHLDVASDIAFLAMDLDGHECRPLSRYFVRRMADELDDEELIDVVGFYKVYRAYVRGKVEGMRAAETEIPEDEKAASIRRAREHYRWALRYAAAGSRPTAIVVMGRTGSGKTTQAEACAKALGWRHVSSDRIRKELAGVPMFQRTPEDARGAVYGADMTERVYRTIEEAAIETVKIQQRGVVVDATYSSATRRTALRDSLRDADIPYAFVELTADDDTRRERLQRRTDDGSVSDARPDVMETIDKRYEAPSSLWDAHHLRVPTRESIDDTTTDILRALIRLHDG